MGERGMKRRRRDRTLRAAVKKLWRVLEKTAGDGANTRVGCVCGTHWVLSGDQKKRARRALCLSDLKDPTEEL